MIQPWQEPQKAVPAPSWWNLTAYQEGLLQIPQDMVCNVKHRTVAGKDYYVLVRHDYYVEEREEWELAYFLDHVDGDALGTESHRLYLEEGKAYFDTEEFCHLLEICKRYAQTSSLGNSINMDTELEAARKRLKKGEILCYKPLDSSGDFCRFCEDMADLGEGYHMVGYPTEDGNGNYMSCYEGIAICANTEHADIAAEFLNYIVSRKCQEDTFNPVRRDTFTERLSPVTNFIRADASPAMFLRTPQGSLELEAKPDGTSYLPEYLAFMDGCRISAGITEPIEKIISEEADAFFAGDKDAQTVANIIQSRVRLYLDENW